MSNTDDELAGEELADRIESIQESIRVRESILGNTDDEKRSEELRSELEELRSEKQEAAKDLNEWKQTAWPKEVTVYAHAPDDNRHAARQYAPEGTDAFDTIRRSLGYEVELTYRLFENGEFELLACEDMQTGDRVPSRDGGDDE